MGFLDSLATIAGHVVDYAKEKNKEVQQYQREAQVMSARELCDATNHSFGLKHYAYLAVAKQRGDIEVDEETHHCRVN